MRILLWIQGWSGQLNSWAWTRWSELHRKDQETWIEGYKKWNDEKLNYLKTKIIKMAKGLMMVWLCIMWLILLPFIWLFDRAFGGWK